ncbi:hypothetical protein F2Q69_00028851 [Brassica cretica]|uniref:Uncharacterized protein n=1 Tax=Brassica cretica TaxID=69181 RepID=A0A8S9S7M5_BRACR|nr:hypothetical protein F2Q69_00028851 [Brassica cretica]
MIWLRYMRAGIEEQTRMHGFGSYPLIDVRDNIDSIVTDFDPNRDCTPPSSARLLPVPVWISHSAARKLATIEFLCCILLLQEVTGLEGDGVGVMIQMPGFAAFHVWRSRILIAPCIS